MWTLRLHNLKFVSFGGPLRQCRNYKTKAYMKAALLDSNEDLIKKYAPKLIYNSIIEKKLRFKPAKPKEEETDPLPVTLKYLYDDVPIRSDEKTEETPSKTPLINFPYDSGHVLQETNPKPIEKSPKETLSRDVASEARDEVHKRYELQKELKNWMLSYDSYDDSGLEENQEPDDWKINYGTPDPHTPISKTPCGGCGALLHCKDTAIPGYIPSEIFKNCKLEGGASLEAIICQRCHFLKNYNLALQVQVTPEDYPKVLSTVSKRQGLVILMVDLLDFPCSVWPGIGEIFGRRTPVVLVGNKVDLLPQDSRKFLKHVRQRLLDCVKLQGFGTFNIKEVALISAKTGYGVEDLITKLNNLNWIKGDVYIVGCTNVGKSSLFNALLQSDFCKTQAVDLIQRATTSVWPGTTLNLLKFPIKRPSGYRQYLRHKRLQALEKIEAEERIFRKEQLKVTRNPKYASLIGHIDITKNPDSYNDDRDLFIVQNKSNDSGVTQMGVDETSSQYVYGKWCYDTPGVVQPDQITHLLTTEELLLTLPKQLIVPRTFCIKPGSTMFIGGLARLDYVEGDGSLRLTVFASNELPVTVCPMDDSDELYIELLGTELFRVPMGAQERMRKWPRLEKVEFGFKGEDWERSANDIVLSSAGWVALTGQQGVEYKLQAWTPEKRGIYLRECLLPNAVALSGKRIRSSVAYGKFKFFLE